MYSTKAMAMMVICTGTVACRPNTRSTPAAIWMVPKPSVVATPIAVATTAAIVAGSVYRTLPPACAPSPYGGVTYYSCGGYWYQPRYAGSSVEYVVVSQPY
jgi:hypothetical protein